MYSGIDLFRNGGCGEGDEGKNMLFCKYYYFFYLYNEYVFVKNRYIENLICIMVIVFISTFCYKFLAFSPVLIQNHNVIDKICT